MFTFFHRSKEIVVDCFTTDAMAHEYSPMVRGSKMFPSWWKKLPTNDVNNKDFDPSKRNMKKCYGFLELYKRSLILPCWADLHFKVTQNEGYFWNKTSGPPPEEHSSSQYEGGFNNYYHSKLSSPWFIKEKTGTHFLFTAASWNLENYEFIVPPGIVEYRINHATNVNILFPKKKENYSFFIPIGKPLVHIIPLQEKIKFKVHNHLISHEEMMKMALPRSFGGIFPLMEIKDKKSKCPFGFS